MPRSLPGASPSIALREMAGVYAAQGQPRQAVARLEAALRDTPSDPVALLQLGELLLDLDEPGQAAPYLRHAVAAAPDNPEARAALARALGQ